MTSVAPAHYRKPLLTFLTESCTVGAFNSAVIVLICKKAQAGHTPGLRLVEHVNIKQKIQHARNP